MPIQASCKVQRNYNYEVSSQSTQVFIFLLSFGFIIYNVLLLYWSEMKIRFIWSIFVLRFSNTQVLSLKKMMLSLYTVYISGMLYLIIKNGKSVEQKQQKAENGSKIVETEQVKKGWVLHSFW